MASIMSVYLTDEKYDYIRECAKRDKVKASAVFKKWVTDMIDEKMAKSLKGPIQL